MSIVELYPSDESAEIMERNLDLAAIEQLILDCQGFDFVSELIDDFLFQCEERLASLRSGEQAPAAQRRALHTMKGGARTLGLVRFGEVCDSLEATAAAQGLSEEDLVGLDEAFGGAAAALRQLQEDAST